MVLVKAQAENTSEIEDMEAVEDLTEVEDSKIIRPKPVETGFKEYDASITEISKKVDGIARIEGFVIFVKGGQVRSKRKNKDYTGRRTLCYCLCSRQRNFSASNRVNLIIWRNCILLNFL
jgi:predicted RNA-binding protein with TRAM domain